MVCRWCIAVSLVVALAAALHAEDAPAKPFEQRHADLTRQFVSDLEVLAAKCEELGLSEQAAQTRAWIAPRRSGRMVFFFAGRTEFDTLPASSPERVRQWHERFLKLRQEFADKLFAIASEAAAQREGEIAFQLVREVIHEDADHEEARRILGLSKIATRKPVARAGVGEHRQFGWRRGQHWTVESRHFSIESNHSPKACLELVEELEKLHDIWRQLFFPVWGIDERVAAQFAGQTNDRNEVKRFRVVLLKDRQEYLRQLSQSGNVGVSSGIYLDEEKTSVFFAGPEAKTSTWYHEVSHQLFQEYLDAPPGVAKENNVWLLEAAALFMESLVLGDGYALLGGYDADNVQFARYRIRGGDFYLPLAELSVLGREKLQTHSEIRKIYSQSAGLGHFFLEGKYRKAFLSSLLAVYQGRVDRDTLATACQATYEKLDQEFKDFLDVTDAMVARTPPLAAIRNLSLRRTSITDTGLKAFYRCDQLEWLDLSLTTAGNEGLLAFPASKHLQQLFLERTKITDAVLHHVAEFPQLEELYLSATTISDAGVAKLTTLRKLKQLDLAGCPVTDDCLAALAELKQLEQLDLSDTKVTSTGVAQLKRSLPKLTVQTSSHPKHSP